MSYTIASIKRVKVDNNGNVSLFLEPAIGNKVKVESKSGLLVIPNSAKTEDVIDAKILPIGTEFKFNNRCCCKAITSLLLFWFEKKTLLKIVFSQITYTITSIEMYEDDEK